MDMLRDNLIMVAILMKISKHQLKRQRHLKTSDGNSGNGGRMGHEEIEDNHKFLF